jgi:hypothetical protein
MIKAPRVEAQEINIIYEKAFSKSTKKCLKLFLMLVFFIFRKKEFIKVKCCECSAFFPANITELLLIFSGRAQSF